MKAVSKGAAQATIRGHPTPPSAGSGRGFDTVSLRSTYWVKNRGWGITWNNDGGREKSGRVDISGQVIL